MLPASPKSDTPGHGVWVPIHLAHALFECYYGQGRRFRDAPPPAVDTSTHVGEKHVQQVDAPHEVSMEDVVTRPSIPKGFIPRGVAAHKPPAAPPATVDPAGGGVTGANT